MTETFARIKVPEIERTLLGVFFLDPDQIYQCTDLSVEDFALDSHRRIYRAMIAMQAEGVPVDIATVYEHLQARKQADAVGGAAYLSSLTEGLPRRLNPLTYVAIIREKAKLRRIAELCERVQSSVLNGEESSAAVAGAWEEGMVRILDDCAEDEPLVSAYMDAVIEQMDAEATRPAGVQGRSYGLAELDHFTGGMGDGEVTVVGARSGVGKTSLLVQTTVANCRAGKVSDVYSLEMKRGAFLRRVLSIVSGVPLFKLRDPRRRSAVERSYILAAAKEVKQWKLRIYDRSEMDISQVVAMARLSIRKNGTEFLGVDYAQIMAAPGKDDRARVSGVSRALTALVKHSNASLMLLSQLVKTDKQNYSRAPVIGDLRETGQLENDAHVVLLLHRPWDADMQRISNVGEIIIPKYREGETGVIPVGFDRNYAVFTGGQRG